MTNCFLQSPMETAETTPAGIKESGVREDADLDEFLPKLGKLKKVAKANKELTKQNTQLQSTVDALREERDALQSEQEKLKRDRMSLEKELVKFRQGSLEVEIDTTEFEEKIERLEAKVAEKEEQRASLHRKLELQTELYAGKQATNGCQELEHRGTYSGAPKSKYSSSVKDAGSPSLALDRLLEEQGISSRLRKENGELKLRIASLEAELEHAQPQQQEETATEAVKHRRSSTFFRRGEKKHRSATAIVRRPNQKEVTITDPERSLSPELSLSASNSYQDFGSRKRSTAVDSPLTSPMHSPRMTHRNAVSAGSHNADMSSLQSCLKLALEEKKSSEEQKKELEEELSKARGRIKQLQKSTAQTRKQTNAGQETEVLKQSLKLALSEKSSFEERLESLQKEVDGLTAQNKSQEKSLSDFTVQRDSRQRELERENERLRKDIEQLKSSASKQSPDQRASRRRSVESTKELPPQVAAREEKSRVVTKPPPSPSAVKPPPSPSAVTAKPLNREKTPDPAAASSRPARRNSVDKTKDVGSKKVAAARALFEEKIEDEKAQAEASSPKRLRRKSSSGSVNAPFSGGSPKSKTADDNKPPSTPTSSSPSHAPSKSTHAPLTPQRSSGSSLTSLSSPPTAPKPLNRSHAPLSFQRSGNGFSANSKAASSSSSCSTAATTATPTITTPTGSGSSSTAKPTGSKVSIISVKTSISPTTSPRLSSRKQMKEIVICSPKMEKKPLPVAGSTHAKSNSFDASKPVAGSTHAKSNSFDASKPGAGSTHAKSNSFDASKPGSGSTYAKSSSFDASKISPVEQQNTKSPVTTKSLSFSQQVTVYPPTTSSPRTATPASPSANNPSQQWRSSAASPTSTTTPKISMTSTKTATTTTVKSEKVTIKQMPGKLRVPDSVEVRRASSLQDIPERVSSSGDSSSSTGSGMVSGPNRSGVQLRANRRAQRGRPVTLCHTETTNLVNLISKMREQDKSVRQQPIIVNGAMNGKMDGSSSK